MKLKYILAAGVVALLAGCDESRFLDTKPQGTLNDDLLSSAEGVELLVTSAYAGLKGPNRDMHWVPMTNWTYGEVRSDNAYKGGGGVNDGDFCTLLETFKIDATWANADEKWFQLYCCLQRCNSALRVMNTLDENTLPVLKSRKAEMKVIRAHFFFELVRLFKQVPYFDENVDIDDYKYIPNNQFTREELLGKIAQEFLDAANDLPDTQSQIGRITKNIAYAYAAKTKLYQAYQQDENNQVIAVDKQLLAEVAALCDKVGAQGKAYDLLNDFQKLDQLEYENGVQQVYLNGENVSSKLRTEAVGNMASNTSVYAPVRKKLVELQRELAGRRDVVMDGRDIGTAVLPDAKEQSQCSIAGAELKEGQTSPPKHFTEDLLLHAMETASANSMPEGVERQGIGTPATRAATIEKLVQKGFLERKGNKKTKVLLPTDKGKALITVMPEEIQSPEMTADWETKLLQIERGEMEPSEFMTEINTMITELVKNTEMKKGANALMKNKIIGICPNCGANVVEREKGWFCENRECRFVLWKDNAFFKRLGKHLDAHVADKRLDGRMADKLLRDGRVRLKDCKSAKGKTYNATVLLSCEADGRSKFSLEFEGGC